MTEDEAREKVGGLLQHLREMRKMSQEDMADVLGIPRSAVSLIETGDRGIDFTELIDYAKTFKKHIEELLKPVMNETIVENPKSPPKQETPKPEVAPAPKPKPEQPKVEGRAKPFNTVRFSVMSENQTEISEAAQLYAPISAVTQACEAFGIGMADVATSPVLHQQAEAASLCRATVQIELPMNNEQNKVRLNTLVDNLNTEFPASQMCLETDVNGMLGLHSLSFLTMNQ